MYYHRVSAVEILAKSSLAETPPPTTSPFFTATWRKGMNEKCLDANERVAVGRSGCLSHMDCMSQHAAIVGVR